MQCHTIKIAQKNLSIYNRLKNNSSNMDKIDPKNKWVRQWW